MLQIHSETSITQDQLLSLLHDYENKGKWFVKGNRNSIKIFEINGQILSVKSFKKPHIINQIAYGYFRKSKAQRSFEYASILKEKGIGTPLPIAYYEEKNVFGLQKSYYVCEHLEDVFEFRAIIENPFWDDRSKIIKAFTKFTAQMHDEGIEFLDHSPGNTLIRKEHDGNYTFYLVDLNRMRFHPSMNWDTRLKNLSKITPKQEMIALISDEYAKIVGKDSAFVFEKLWAYTCEFQHKFHRKRALKKQLKFWQKE